MDLKAVNMFVENLERHNRILGPVCLFWTVMFVITVCLGLGWLMGYVAWWYPKYMLMALFFVTVLAFSLIGIAIRRVAQEANADGE